MCLSAQPPTHGLSQGLLKYTSLLFRQFSASAVLVSQGEGGFDCQRGGQARLWPSVTASPMS